jgi:hypothetical protein
MGKPMDPILDEFRIDLNKLRKLIDLLESVKIFASTDDANIKLQESNFLEQANKVLKNSKECHPNVVILTGTLLLYLGGRFEYFVRAEFEFLCERVAARCQSYKNLPREMRDNIIGMTAAVIAEPRKYGHGEQGVRSFISNLASILSENTKLGDVNSACLSITDGNMRADTLNELFQRIGAKNIWDKISQQAKVMVFFETPEAGEARNKAQALLNTFMDIRNRIAHPSAGIDWPDSAQVRSYIDFFDILAGAISEVINVYEISLSSQKVTQKPTSMTTSQSN